MKLLTFFILLILLSPALAEDIENYEVLTELNTNGITSNTVSFLLNDNLNEMSFTIFAKITNFKYSANFNVSECFSQDNILGTEVRCSFASLNETKRVVKFEYETVSYTKTEGKRGVFNANFRLLNDVKTMSVAIKLPEGFVLTQDASLPSFSPKEGVITSDGRRIIVQWFKSGIPANTDLTFSLLYEDKRPEPLADLSRVVVTSFILLILFGVVMWFVVKGKQKEQTETILEVLTSDERKVINIIKESGGSVTQKKIVETTDYSKAKISRIVKDLQIRGIIAVEPSGRENLLTLTKKIRK